MHKLIHIFLALKCLAFAQIAVATAPVSDYSSINNNKLISSTVSVSFADSSSTFRPGVSEATILATARDASMVTINGRTSTNHPSAQDEALALKRAVSARAWLIARGVSPLKIMINYVSAADFMVDNATPEGRKINQRVDIEIIFVPTAY